MPRDAMEPYRYFLKDQIRKSVDFSQTDQSRGVPPPPVEKPFDEDAPRIDLPRPGEWQTVQGADLIAAIRDRQSHRRYLPESISLEELSFLLWATQGIRKRAGHSTLRTVPSAGARHALETYLCALNVEGLEVGVYRYLPVEHQLLFEFANEHLANELAVATLGQRFIATAPVTFVWTAIPYRTEWRYGIASHKVIALDAGHVCQNLYLACAAIGAGTCAIAAYDQGGMDHLLRADGQDEFVIYLAPVGKV